MRSRRPSPRSSLTALLLLAATAACGDDPVEPNLSRDLVAGSYLMTALSFDPSGSLGPVDVAAVLGTRGKALPILTLLDDGRLQLLFEDPNDPLNRLVEGTFLTTPEGAQLNFGSASSREELLLPRTLVLVRAENGTLSAEAVLENGVSRAALRALAPELEQEPLSDPVPGTLTVRFTPE